MQTKEYRVGTARNKFLEALDLEKPEVLKALHDRVLRALTEGIVNRAVVNQRHGRPGDPIYVPRALMDHFRMLREVYMKDIAMPDRDLIHPDERRPWLDADEKSEWMLASLRKEAAKDLVPVRWSEMKFFPDCERSSFCGYRTMADAVVGWGRSYNLADDDWCLEAVAQTLIAWIIQEKYRLHGDPPYKNPQSFRWAYVRYSSYDHEAVAKFREDAFRWLALFHTGASPKTIGRKFHVSERYVEIVIGKLYPFIGLTRREPRGGPRARKTTPFARTAG